MPPPRGRGRGALRGGGSFYVSPSLCLPWAGTRAGVIGVAQFMEGVASILLRFMSACRQRLCSAGRPCVLVRVGLPVVVTVGAGGWRPGCVWRMDLAAFPNRVPRLSLRVQGGVEGRRPLGPPPVSRGPEGGEWGGEGEGGSRHGSSPPPSGSPARTLGGCGGVTCSPLPRPPLMAGGGAPRVPPWRLLGRGCLAAPGAGRSLAGRWWVSLVWGGGGGGRCAAPRRWLGREAPGGGGWGITLLRFVPLPPPGRHQGGPLQRCPVPHTAAARVHVPPPGCGTRVALARRRRAAGLPRLLWEWAAADFGRAANRPGGAPPWVPRPSRGGESPLAWRGDCGATVLRLSVGMTGDREKKGGAPRCLPLVPRCCSPVAAGWRPDGLGPGGSAADGGGGRTPLLLPFHPLGVRLSCGPSSTGPPLVSSPSPRRVALAGGEEGRVGGRLGWRSGSAVSG